MESIKEEVGKHPSLQRLVKLCKQGEVIGPWDYKEGILYFKNKIYLAVDPALIPLMVKEIHSSTYAGYHKTLQRIRSVFYWQGMRNFLREYIKSCETCQRHKRENLKLAGFL
ncbi:hypothetical protein CsSME_00033822 [Camellia sinensis var. sinensis]